LIGAGVSVALSRNGTDALSHPFFPWRRRNLVDPTPAPQIYPPPPARCFATEWYLADFPNSWPDYPPCPPVFPTSHDLPQPLFFGICFAFSNFLGRTIPPVRFFCPATLYGDLFFCMAVCFVLRPLRFLPPLYYQLPLQFAWFLFLPYLRCCLSFF